MSIDQMIAQLIKACQNILEADDVESVNFEHDIAAQIVLKITARDEILVQALEAISNSNDNTWESSHAYNALLELEKYK